MSNHTVTLEPRPKMDAPNLWGWSCSCGSKSRGPIGSRKEARDAGYQHRVSKRRNEAAHAARVAEQIRALAR